MSNWRKNNTLSHNTVVDTKGTSLLFFSNLSPLHEVNTMHSSVTKLHETMPVRRAAVHRAAECGRVVYDTLRTRRSPMQYMFVPNFDIVLKFILIVKQNGFFGHNIICIHKNAFLQHLKAKLSNISVNVAAILEPAL